jgi:indole-3-glycerol phosphate synthase
MEAMVKPHIPGILGEIVQTTLQRVTRARLRRPIMELMMLARVPLPLDNLEDFRITPHAQLPFARALAQEGLALICEVKRASPSRGNIAPFFNYVEIAREYERSGAAAISVVTEPDYFKGSDTYLQHIAAAVAIPILRKDFIVDVYQIYEAKALGASAILLICAILEPIALRFFLEIAHEIGLSVVVEAHNEEEIAMALRAGAYIIGVNNRDLHTFTVDLATSLRLRASVPARCLFIAESGVQEAADIARLRSARVDAVLIGETLMRSPDRTALLMAFREAALSC